MSRHQASALQWVAAAVSAGGRSRKAGFTVSLDCCHKHNLMLCHDYLGFPASFAPDFKQENVHGMNTPDTEQEDLTLFAGYRSDNLDLTWATPFTNKKALVWWDVCPELACPAVAIRARTLKLPRQIPAARAWLNWQFFIFLLISYHEEGTA